MPISQNRVYHLNEIYLEQGSIENYDTHAKKLFRVFLLQVYELCYFFFSNACLVSANFIYESLLPALYVLAFKAYHVFPESCSMTQCDEGSLDYRIYMPAIFTISVYLLGTNNTFCNRRTEVFFLTEVAKRADCYRIIKINQLNTQESSPSPKMPKFFFILYFKKC